MTTHPLVSIVTPSLNPGARLKACLDSVSAQTYRSIEHIIVDGGSTDGSPELAERRGLRVLSEPDDGQANALNKGFRLASGEYLGWLNADDLLVPDALQRVVDTFADGNGVGWVYGHCEVQRAGAAGSVIYGPGKVDERTLDLGNRIAQPGTFVARWAMDRVGPLDEAFHLAMDFDLWLRLVDGGVRAERTPGVLAVFEIHDASKTGSIGASEFHREEALALLKSGRRTYAAAALGRAAASAAMGTDGRVDPSDLEVTIERFTREAVDKGLADDVDALRAAAQVQASRLELEASASPRGLRHIAQPAPWGSPVGRRMIAASGRATLATAWRRTAAAVAST